MAAPAEVIKIVQAPPETYAHSHSKLRLMGALAVDQEVVLEGIPAREQALADCISGVREMLRTDPEFHNKLDIDDKREHAVVNNKARDIDGTPMVEIVETGQRNSEALARTQPKFQAQANRDMGDVQTAKTADDLRPGECWLAPSMDPKRALEQYPEVYRDVLGYREGLMYWQWYTKVSEDSMVAGSCSVDMSKETVWREILAGEGLIIPPDESPDTWILHGIKRNFKAEEAEQFIKDLRNRYYRRIGVTGRRYSISEYVKNNSDTVEGIFDAYYPALAKALYTGRNNETLQGLANALLKTDLSKMKPAIKSQLIKIANSPKFDDELGKTVDAVIRYAIVEELRKGLGDLVNGSVLAPGEKMPLPVVKRLENISHLPPEVLNARLANNVQSGIQAGRTYGGCPGQVQFTNENNKVGLGNLQKAYGGRSGSRSKERIGNIRRDRCAVKSCPTQPNIVEVGGCGVCLGRCQKLFDAGKDPTKMGAENNTEEEKSFGLALIFSLAKKRKEKESYQKTQPDSTIQPNPKSAKQLNLAG